MEKVSINPNEERVLSAVEAVTSPETFDFAAAVSDRNYPEFEVPVFLDERLAQQLLAALTEKDELEDVIGRMKNPTEEHAAKLEEVVDRIDSITDELIAKRFVVRIKGISPEEMVNLEKESYEMFPREYEDEPNMVTGKVTKKELDNEDRDEYFALRLRMAHIVSVTAPNGAVDSDFEDVEKMRVTWSRLPLVARVKIDEAINESTIAVDYYRSLVNEVF